MSDDKKSTPEWENSHNWDEFEWEQALKYSDHLAARYFRMLERFGDLPDGEEFIVAKLGDSNFFEFEDDGDFLDLDDWDEPEVESSSNDDFEENEEEEFTTPGDELFFETNPCYQRARQISLGWCNILATVLQPTDRMWGLKLLFSFGRILSYLAISIGDGTFERLNGSIAFAKRALQQINDILGELDSYLEKRPQYKGMFNMIREHLLETHDLVINYLLELRRRRDKKS